MHNGNIADFNTLKRRLQSDLPEVPFNMVQGNTGAFTPSSILFWRLTAISRCQDSEWAFALFLSKVLLSTYWQDFMLISFFSFQIVTHELSRQKP